MTELYGTKPLTLWIDTPREIAMSRISTDKGRGARLEDESVKQYFDSTFAPSGNLEQDCSNFTRVLKALLQGKNQKI